MTGNVCSGCICVNLLAAKMLLQPRVHETGMAGHAVLREPSALEKSSLTCIR